MILQARTVVCEKINNNNAVGGDLLCTLASTTRSMHTVIVEDTSCVVPRSTDSPRYTQRRLFIDGCNILLVADSYSTQLLASR